MLSNLRFLATCQGLISSRHGSWLRMRIKFATKYKTVITVGKKNGLDTIRLKKLALERGSADVATLI